MVKMNYPGEIVPLNRILSMCTECKGWFDTRRIEVGIFTREEDYDRGRASTEGNLRKESKARNNFETLFDGWSSQERGVKGTYLPSKGGGEGEGEGGGRLRVTHHASHRGSLSPLYGRIVLRRLSLEPYHLALLREQCFSLFLDPVSLSVDPCLSLPEIKHREPMADGTRSPSTRHSHDVCLLSDTYGISRCDNVLCTYYVYKFALPTATDCQRS